MNRVNMALTEDQLEALAELLLGMAYVDDELEDREFDLVYEMLDGLTPGKLPEFLDDYILTFDPDALVVEASVARLGFTEPNQRQVVLNMLASIAQADEVLALSESDFLKQVGAALGAQPDEYELMTLDIISEGDLPTPPPLPKD